MNKGGQDHFDLQLSGHVHKGQVFPFGWFERFFFPMISGLYDLPNDALLYVSRGSGTWGPPIRVLAPPEVTVIDLVPEESSPGVQPEARLSSRPPHIPP